MKKEEILVENFLFFVSVFLIPFDLFIPPPSKQNGFSRSQKVFRDIPPKEIKEISPNPIYYQIKGVPLPD